MQLHEIDPTRDARWADLVDRCDASSVFHTPAWLAALQRTYGYEPVAFTDATGEEALENGLVFCRVRSWMTGCRLVSLPFSDHCEPLVAQSETLSSMMVLLKERLATEGRYIELRPLQTSVAADGFERAAAFHHHVIDLRPDLGTIFSGFHKNHVQRTIRKALRLGVTAETGRSPSLLDEFYALQTLTRQRHNLPVQPRRWFQNVIDCLGDEASIYVARHAGEPVAAMLTARHKKTLVYKYGRSNAAQHRYGGPSLLFWTAIERAKERGLVEFDLGRSDMDDEGLVAFKDHLGAKRSALYYYRCTKHHPRSVNTQTRSRLKGAYSLVPRVLRSRVGSSLYRHFG
jgi:CelD/BcsL family acetyltransferase involved in cellulose biosynthesis